MASPAAKGRGVDMSIGATHTLARTGAKMEATHSYVSPC